MFKILMSTVLIVLLSGCAGAGKPVSNLGCSGENWKELGTQAAKAYKPVRSFDAYIESCGSRLESGAKSAFIDGYAREIIGVCTYDSGYQLGSSNQALPDICPLEIRDNFQQGYAAGNRVYKEKLQQLKTLVDEKEQRSMRRGNLGRSYGVGDSGTGTATADDSM
ncbi:DUF2799 domain-containing protein [Cellvibrio sp. UBA7661]|uniref:DUF2799 domain-containing protein n=1 Tax=Cellvibrio sp. UBA7661 TaxID=1946311 RepID=UPI002F35CEB9